MKSIFFSFSQIKGFETLSVPCFSSILNKIFKAESDIISFSKPLAQETSSQLQAQKNFKKRQVPKYYFQNKKCQKRIFKAMTAKNTFSKKYQKVFKATSAQNKIQSDKNKKIIFKEVSDKNFLKRLQSKIILTATRANNHFQSDKSKKSFHNDKR